MSQVLSFLTSLFKQGLGLSAINTARSAVSSVVITPGGGSIGTNRLVSKFVKGVAELRPSLPRYCATWDVSVLLDFWENQPDNKLLSLKELTLKLCCLLLLLSAQRVQTVHTVKVQCILFHDTGCSIQLIEKLKHSRPGKHQGSLNFQFYSDKPKLCVVSCLKEYINRTKPLRGKSEQLFLCYAKPHGPASKDTLCRWLRTAMEWSGVDTDNFKPHSFRSASSSAAHKFGVPLETVLEAAGWSRAETFRKFYNRPVQNAKGVDYANSILKYFSASK